MTEQELIELNLGKSSQTRSETVDKLIEILDRVMELISEVAVGNEHLKTTPELRTELTEFRKFLCGRGSVDSASLQKMADKCISECEDFFSRAREYSLNREIEFIEIIDVLRETVRVLMGQADAFNRSLIGSSERFRMLLEVDDLHTLKQQITSEAQELARLVEEKQKVDEANYSKLSGKIENLQRRLERAEEESLLDPLTQVANRGTFDQTIQAWAKNSKGPNAAFSLVMVDVDNFKAINDQYGHPIGDRVLLGAAQLLGKSIRSGDIVCRYGGEEFAVLLRNCGLERAKERFDQILSQIASTQYEYTVGGRTGKIRFTASCGVAEFAPGENVEDLVHRADEALYEAKKGGKNRAVARKKTILRGLFKGRRPAA